MQPIFRDRRDAGRAVAHAMADYAGRDDLLVLALPRGGVPVAYEIADALNATLDLMLVRKLGVPGHEELAMGAIATGGARVVNRDVVDALAIPESTIAAVEQKELRELRRREIEYRGSRPAPDLQDKRVVLVDDGLATGASMLAAVDAVRQRNPRAITVAVPVAPPSTIEQFRRRVDEVICPHTPEPFFGVGAWYSDFEQTTDDEVRWLLEQAWSRQHNGHR
jgi:predicted phosphoribosyltransferase